MREECPVKTILAAALIVALGFTGITLWGVVHTRFMDVSSSQIFIHGEPVCVMQQAGEIRASLGMCDALKGEWKEDGGGNGGGFHGGMLSPVEPDMSLPPGHPPVDIPPDTEGGGRTLI